MILADVLELSGFNRNTYNALARGDEVPFMEGQGRDRFGLAHAVALRCGRRLMDLGIQSSVAMAAITDTFRYIELKIGDLQDHTKKFAVGDWLVVVNYGGAFGWQTADAPADAVAKIAEEATAFDAFSVAGVSLREAFVEVKIAVLNRAGFEAA